MEYFLFISAVVGDTLCGETRDICEYNNQLWHLPVLTGDLPVHWTRLPEETGRDQVGHITHIK